MAIGRQTTALRSVRASAVSLPASDTSRRRGGNTEGRMIQEPLDFKRALQLVRRHKIIVVIAAVLGLVAGVALAVLRPPMLTSQALVVLPPSTHGAVGTQLVGTQ